MVAIKARARAASFSACSAGNHAATLSASTSCNFAAASCVQVAAFGGHSRKVETHHTSGLSGPNFCARLSSAGVFNAGGRFLSCVSG
jgi:hypothetical protein